MTIVVPAFNAAATIAEAIGSVLAQSVPDFELLIADDCSGDDTARVVAQFADPRIRLLRNERNLGPGPSRDKLIAQARGRWIAFMDADDAWAPDRLEVLLPHAEGHAQAMVFDDLLLCQQKDGRIVPWKPLGRRADFSLRARDAGEVSLAAYLSSRTLLLKPLVPRAAITGTGLLHSARNYGEDAEFFIRLMHSGLAAWFVDRPLYLYRLTPGSLSAQDSRAGKMVEVLQSLAAELDFDAATRSALEAKCARLRRKADYDLFLLELERSGAGAGLRGIIANPALLVEFARRFPNRFATRVRARVLGTTGR